MAKKYDTNPLDGEVLRRAEEVRRTAPAPERPTATLEESSEAQTKFFEAQTRRFATVATAEVPPTQQLGGVDFEEPYQSVFNKPQHFSAAGNTSVSSAAQKLIVPPTSRAVAGIGLPEKLVMLLPYLPMTVGAIAAVFILLLSSRTETRVRFHAAQGLALHLATWLLGAILAVTSEIMPFGSLPTRFFTLAYIIFFIICLVRVWQGKPNHVESLDDITDFLNEKIKPRK
jgi:uncharacterized membrane protein